LQLTSNAEQYLDSVDKGFRMSLHERSNSSSLSAECMACGVPRNHGERCDYCGALYLDMINSASSGIEVGSLHNKYKIKQSGNDVEISWHWRNIAILALIPFFIFWNSITFSGHALGDLITDPLSVFPFPGMHMIIGILGPLYALVHLINKTSIVANARYLTIKHHPIPWRGNKQFDARNIQQIFVSKGIRSKNDNSWNVPILQLVTITGTRHELLKGQREVEFADYEALRRHLLKALNKQVKSAQGQY